MAKAKIWGYGEAKESFNRPSAIRQQIGWTPEMLAKMGGGQQEGGVAQDVGINRTWEDILRGSAFDRYGAQANGMTAQQLEADARQHGILDSKYSTSMGEDLMEGITGPLALPAAFLGAGLYTGAFSGAGAGAAGLAEGAAAGAQFPSQVMASGNLMPAAIPESASTLSGWGLTEVSPGVWSAGGAGAGSLGGAAAGGAQGAPTGGAGGTAGAGGAVGGATSGIGGAVSKALSNPSILGAAGGALLGGMSGGGQSGTITTESGVPDWLQPYLKPALDQYSTMLRNYNTDPYGVMPAAMKNYQDTVSGMYLDPATNKYLEEYFNAGAERVKGTLSPSFGHMQAFGQHSGYNEALAGGLSDLATGIYGGAYEKERDRQSQLVMGAPNFLGSASDAAFAPYSQYIGAISGLGKKQQQPYFSNPFGNIMGGAMAGYGLGNIFK